MPRIIPPENLGCPPIRALTFDSLGLIKVTEARGKERGTPTVVNTWGEMNASRTVLAASIDDRLRNPLLAVARKDGNVEILNPCNGDLHFAYSVYGDDGCSPEDNEISALHLFRKKIDDQAERSCTLLTCTKKGDVSLRSVKFPDAHSDSTDDSSPKTWKACGSGEILVGKVDGSENFSVFGGRRVEATIWDLEQCTKIWSAKSPPKDNLGIFTPTWFTSATFLSKDDHRKFVTGTKSHQVRLYDISTQRRPVLSFDFRETAITSIAEDPDGHTIYVGNASADLASFDIRTGKLLGSFLGKCSGSIRSVVRHPQHQVIASCGLDRYLRVYDVKTRQLISAVFLKQHLTGLVFDSGFTGEAETAVANTVAEAETEEIMEQEDDETEKVPVKRKKSKKEKRSREIDFEDKDDEENEDGTEKAPVKTKKSRKEKRSRENVPEAEEKDELRSKKSREHKKITKKVKHNQEEY
ncbi:PREDICTED: WD repeat-containing protein 74 isoform X1 [Camelina sativa]|uniref:WD repeat-containing protein 74 isoform X1 n=1 Tax=Camelina sativa TaxID=90675 RepID=A0ABM0VT34_CAMSA|nr:PREDICTED: WD repeat-containing protein 74 isoform X1 [Camelina sativa]